MSTHVRPGVIDGDEHLIVKFLERNHSVDSNAKRFDWLYRKGPAGPARVWISSDSKSQEVVGVAAAFPRLVRIESRVERGWVLGDFCIAGGHRTLGPALELQRACLASLENGNRTLFYDFPSAAMVAVYRRMGMGPRQSVVRLARPLRVNRQIDGFIKLRPLASVASSLVNTGLAIGSFGIRRSGDTVEVLKGDCEEEFTQLAQSVGSTMGVCLQRSSEYLNWRYRQHPSRRYEIVTMRSGACLIGFAVVSQEGQHLSVVDIFGKQEAIAGLLQTVISMARRRKLDTVTIALIASHPWVRILRRMGFRRRETFALIIQCPYNHPGPAPDHAWYLTNGDRES